MYHLVVLLAGRAPGRDQLQLGERVAARGGDGGQGAQARRASQVASAASAARDACCTSTAASIAGFRMSAGTTCWSSWTTPTARFITRSWWKRKRRRRCWRG